MGRWGSGEEKGLWGGEGVVGRRRGSGEVG